MQKIRHVLLLSLSFFSLMGCQNNTLNLTEDISNIEIYEWDSSILVTIVDDSDLISELIRELNRANTYSTANMDYPLPDYELILKNDRNENVFSVGYYKEIVQLGVAGRYLDVSEDKMYQVNLILPFN